MKEISGDTLRIIAAIVVPPIAGTILVAVGATVLQEYGLVLFLLLPVFLGFSSALIYAPRGEKRYRDCLGVAFLSIPVIGFAIMLFAIEGLICLVMALPLALPLIALGVLLGRGVAGQVRDPRAGTVVPLLAFLFMPFLMGFEASDKSTPTVHQVVTTVEIDAPIETVWKSVVDFQIDYEPEGILGHGFAYPINVRTEGAGVGAIRHGNFSTGGFVAQITAWQEPNLLAFDIGEQPPVMTELTPYESIYAAHLEYLRSQKGEFRLFEKDGKTIVKATTFYTHDIAPDIYWKIFSDRIIDEVHQRILLHIKMVAESETANRGK